ncbi:MAG: radical SAM protein [Magnetococcales bacterium]|nr:radical SAM protein [Magnetococcales bacterium]
MANRFPLHLWRNEAARAILAPMTLGRASNWIRPTIATVYLTSYCNSRCTMCDFWQRPRDPNELTSRQWGVIFSRMKAFGVGYITVNASGEIFTRTDLFTILDHLKRLGILFGLNTNGTLITAKRAEQIARLAPRVLTIGLEGVGDSIYEATRGLPNGFTKVMENVNNLKAAGFSSIAFGSVLSTDNVDQWVELAQYALDNGLKGVRFTALHHDYFRPLTHDEPEPTYDPAFIEKADEKIKQLIEMKKKTGIILNSVDYLKRVPEFYRTGHRFFPVPCLQGSNRIELDVYGNVTLCSFMTESLGNLVTDDMETIWQSAIHRQNRNNAFSGNCPRCFLSCYGEENLRLSPGGFFRTLDHTVGRFFSLVSGKG